MLPSLFQLLFFFILSLFATGSNASVAVTSQSPSQPSEMSIQTYLNLHNKARMHHGAANLTWSPFLAIKAQTWANECQPQHSNSTLGPFGENMAAGTGRFSIHALMKLFLDTRGK